VFYSALEFIQKVTSAESWYASYRLYTSASNALSW